MSYVSTIRCSKPLRGAAVSLKAPGTRVSVKARAAEEAAAPASATESTVKQLTQEEFQKTVLENPKPVLVEFWATWCGPCKMLDPVIDDIADSMSDSLDVVKLDTDKNSEIATEYGVRSIPTTMIFKAGKRITTVIGAVPKSSLVETINKCIV